MPNEDNAVKTMKVVPCKSVNREQEGLVSNCPIYEIVDYEKGIIKDNAGFLKRPGQLLVYDVSGLSDEALNYLGIIVRDFKVKENLSSKKEKSETQGKIDVFVPIIGEYQALDHKERVQLGSDFYVLSREEDRILIKPLLYMGKRNSLDDVVIKISDAMIATDAYKKVAGDSFKMVYQGGNTYTEAVEAKDKEL